MGDSIGPRLYSCYRCRNHVALHDNIISKDFQSKNGRAYLFTCVRNVIEGPEADQELIKGLYTMSNVHCTDCREVLGWKYDKAFRNPRSTKKAKLCLKSSRLLRRIGSTYCCCFI